jgi:hypothetical protein
LKVTTRILAESSGLEKLEQKNGIQCRHQNNLIFAGFSEK